MTDSGPPVRTVVCPTCKGASRYASDNAWRPFCSERCRNLDFGAWATESFRVGADPGEAADDADHPQAPPPH